MNDDRGSVMIIFAAFVVAAVGMIALVTDVGASRDARARLITSTDAAALAAAQDYADGENGCNADENDNGVVAADEESVAERRLLANSGDAEMDFCGVSAGTAGGSNTVTVSAHEDISYLFGPVFGDDSGTSYSSTSVVYGRPLSVGGLRPLGLCFDLPQILDWQSKGYPSPSDEYTINFEGNIGVCGDPAGNWGLLDFNGGANSTPEFNDWMANGYPDPVVIGQPVPGKPGVPAGGKDIGIAVGTVIQLPVISYESGSGQNTIYRVVGFIEGELTHVQDSGAQNLRHIKIRFHKNTVTGTCCADGPLGSPETNYYGLVSFQICGTDNDTSNC